MEEISAITLPWSDNINGFLSGRDKINNPTVIIIVVIQESPYHQMRLNYIFFSSRQ